MDKVCKKCDITKVLTEFGSHKKSKDGYKTICKKCLRIDAKLYRLKNKEVVNKRSNKYYHSNKDKVRKYEEENKEMLKEKRKIYYLKNNDEIKLKRSTNKFKENRNLKRRLNNDPLHRLKNSLRSSIGRSIRINGYTKKSRTFEILGCSFEDFKLHLESKFEPWMKWGNYGIYNGELDYGWDIDHIIPLSSVEKEFDIIKLNHHINIQPLCSKINRDIKIDRIDFY